MRGRGTLEVRSSDNPFFQPVSADIGKNLQNSNVEWKVSGASPQFASTKHTVDGNFAFLYTRESDRIGQKVPKPQFSETKMLSRTEFLKQRRERALASSGDVSRSNQDHNSPDDYIPPTPASAEGATYRVDPESYLKVYQHTPKEEDPRYITSSVSCTCVYSYP